MDVRYGAGMGEEIDDDLFTFPWQDRSDPGSPLLGGRYRLRDRVGAGGSATVWLALDEASKSPVALKVIPILTPAAAARARREAAALRLAQLDGVVQVLDDFQDGDTHVIVMAYVEGVRFPGAIPATWEALRDPTFRLLEAAGRLHRLGIVHRDLKPANVLVDAEGRVTVVDLGIASGEVIGPSAPGERLGLGTPRYLAPEQAWMGPVDHRADLYAVGVMLYEVLAGTLPFADAANLSALLASRATTAAIPLAGRGVAAPDAVVRVVDRLLSLRAADRFESAEQVLVALGAATGPAALPWLGSRGPVESVIEAVRAGRPCVVSGPPGSGRRRVLAEAVAILGEGAVVSVEEQGGDVQLSPLSIDDLTALFHGPELALHLPSDSAAVLHARTGGNPGRVVGELDTWCAGGIARWRGDRIVITREGIDRVASGLLGGHHTVEVRHAHLVGARLLPPGSPGRLLHLVDGGDEVGIAEEALVVGAALTVSGSPGRGMVVLALGLGRAPSEAPAILVAHLQTELARAALVSGEPRGLGVAAADILRRSSPLARVFASLLTAWAALERGDHAFAAARVAEVPPLEDPELDSYRQLVLVRLALAADPEAAALLVERARAVTPDDSLLGRRQYEWLGQIRFRQGRFEDAARLHLAGASREPVPRRRATMYCNAGWASLALPDLEDASAQFEQARAIAYQYRFSEIEAFALLGLRKVAWRAGDPVVPSPDLRTSAAMLGAPRLRIEVDLFDAAVAWRAGDRAETARLARSVIELAGPLGSTRAALLARGLVAASEGAGEDALETMTAAAAMGPPALIWQVAALLTVGGATLPRHFTASALESLDVASGFREAALAPQEALWYLCNVGNMKPCST